MIIDALIKIGANYLNETQNEFAGNELANFIRQDVPEIFKQELTLPQGVSIDASPGKGKWAGAPWIAIFDSLVTESAQEGYYPVLLYDDSLRYVFLSMNQGVTQVREEFKDKKSREILSHRAGIIRARLKGAYEKFFSEETLVLTGDTHKQLLSFYEYGHAFGKKYSLDDKPQLSALPDDLGNMIRLYGKLIALGGTTELDTLPAQSDNLYDSELEERRLLRYHFTIERNRKLVRLAKEIHGYKCQICGFDFEKQYGELGREYIEAHHKVPISQLPKERVKLSPREDFAVLCSNCHSMIHRKGAPAVYEEFVLYYKGQQ